MLALDGPLGSWLIARGVAPHRVWRAALDAPDLVVEGHRAYLKAGARVLLTNSFALPSIAAKDKLDDYAIAEVIDSAIELAVKACEPEHSASIHINLGPPSVDDADLAQGVMTRVLTCAAKRIKHGRAVSIWFETLGEIDRTWLRQSMPALGGVPYALSFLLTDTPPADLADLARGAWACGCNCSSFDPKNTSRMQKALHAWSQAQLPRGVKRLAKPALAGTGGVVLPHCERLGFDLIGACCGGSVADIARLGGVEVLQ